MNFDATTYRISSASRIGTILMAGGVICLLLSAIGWFSNADQFFHSYLLSFAFWVSVGLGALFLTMLHHLAGASWSVVLRRMFENLMMGLPVLLILFIPLAFGLGHLYEWSDAQKVAVDELLQKKSAYLNTGFFVIRSLAFFAVWIALSYLLYKYTKEQDRTPSESLTARMKKVSALGIILFSVTLTFAAWDWLMSLDAKWYSTIFGAYYFSGAAIAALAMVALGVVYFRGKRILTKEVSPEHYQDLAKLIFAFTVFWAYMAFSQYFLIWYANIPEETIWYQHRWVGSWVAVSLVIVFGHFVVPFGLLITRKAKRSALILAIASLWMLLMHWVDLYWVVMPNLHVEGFSLSWMDITTLAGIGGVFLAFVWRRTCAEPLIPVSDPKLQASIEFINQ